MKRFVCFVYFAVKHPWPVKSLARHFTGPCPSVIVLYFALFASFCDKTNSYVLCPSRLNISAFRFPCRARALHRRKLFRFCFSALCAFWRPFLISDFPPTCRSPLPPRGNLFSRSGSFFCGFMVLAQAQRQR